MSSLRDDLHRVTGQRKGVRPKTLLKVLGVFIGFIFGIGLLVAFFSGPSHKQAIKTSQEREQTRKVDHWAGKDSEVIRILQNCKIPGTENTVLLLSASYFTIAKAQGNFIEYGGWYAHQFRGSVYRAGLDYKVNRQGKTAKWHVDLSQKIIEPKNQEAFIFSGNNDFLHY